MKKDCIKPLKGLIESPEEMKKPHVGKAAQAARERMLEEKTVFYIDGKVNKKVAIIFVTSNDSIELGREISNLGVQFYGLKPLSDIELNDLLESIPKLVNKHLN